jgi:hypothetical protein
MVAMIMTPIELQPARSMAGLSVAVLCEVGYNFGAKKIVERTAAPAWFASSDSNPGLAGLSPGFRQAALPNGIPSPWELSINLDGVGNGVQRYE